MPNNKTTHSRKFWKKFDYKRAAEILKHSGMLNVDLRKPLTKYQRQKTRELYTENGGTLFRMAKFREESKNRKRLERLAGINRGRELTSDYVTAKVGEAIFKNPNNLSKRQLSELNSLYVKNRKAIKNNPRNYGLRNFVKQKVDKNQAKILKKNGWNIKNGYAYLPTLSTKTKSYLKNLYYYTFPNGEKIPALVEHNYKRVGGKEYAYILQADESELTKLINGMIESGHKNLGKDLIYTSGSRARENLNAQKLDDIGEFMHYVATVVNNKKNHNDGTSEQLIESIRIESNTKPTDKV